MAKQDQNGLVVVHKPRGMTSFDVVRRVRKLARMKKVGHTGTLDPEATGVLPVALGRCTKLSKFLVLDEKRYQFTMRLGEARDTGDLEGEVVRTAPWDHLRRRDMEAELPQFVGDVDQVPPAYSAIKVDGKRAYELARAGEEVKLEARKVRIEELVIRDWRLPEVDLEVRCGPGTYIRSLARDLGEALGSAAHTTMIHRLQVGPFAIDDAVHLEELTPENFWDHVLSPLEMMRSLPKFKVDEGEKKRVRNGQPIKACGPWQEGEAVALYDAAEQLVAVAQCRQRDADGAQLWPRRVML